MLMPLYLPSRYRRSPILYAVATASILFWILIWVMHIVAITSAHRKLNKKRTTATNAPAKLAAKPTCANTKSATSNSCLLQHAQHKQQHANYATQTTNRTTANNAICLPLPGVSIIKPLVGIDANLLRNLETFFELDYPAFELLFCVQSEADAAIVIVDHLLERYPHVDAKLFVGGALVGVNPKINNMQPAYEVARHELVLISDSGIYMKPDTLLDMVAHMHEDVALVHQMPFTTDREGFHGTVEKVYFGTAHARAYLTADWLKVNCTSGMSALMRKNLLDEVGGIKAFGHYLAEDFFFAKSFTDRGWKISVSSQPAWQNANSMSMSTLNSRISRWIKLRFFMVPQWTLLEPFSECIVLGLLASFSISFIFDYHPCAIFLFHVLVWFVLDYILLCTIQNGPLSFSKRDFLAAWLIRECCAPLVFLKSIADLRVTWKSRVFLLKWGGSAEELKQELNEKD